MIVITHRLKRTQYVSDFIKEDLKKFLNSTARIMYIEAAPGSGKTEATIQMLNEYSIHLIEPFNKIVKEKFENTGFYVDRIETRKNFIYTEHDKVVSTPDQFMRYCHIAKELVIVDEIHELYNAYYREKCLDFLKWILLTDKKVIVMSGTPSGEISLFKSHSIEIFKVKYIKDPLYEIKFYDITTDKKLDAFALDMAKKEISNGKFVGIYTNRYWRKLANYTSLMNFLLIHSQEGDHQTPLSDIGKYKGIMYTKVLSCGCDINEPLDVTLIFPSEPLLSTFEITQAIGRFRHADKMRVYFIHHESEGQENQENFIKEWFELYNSDINDDIKSLFKYILKQKSVISEDEKENLILDESKVDILLHILKNYRKHTNLNYILKAFKWESLNDNEIEIEKLEKQEIDENEFIKIFKDYSEIYKDYHESKGYKIFSEVFVKDSTNYVKDNIVHSTSPSFAYSLLKEIYKAKYLYHTENWEEILSYSFKELKRYNNSMYLLYNSNLQNIKLDISKNIQIQDFLTQDMLKKLINRAKEQYTLESTKKESYEPWLNKINAYIERFCKKTNTALLDLLNDLRDMQDWSRNDASEFDFDWIVDNYSSFITESLYVRAHRLSKSRELAGRKGGNKTKSKNVIKIIIENTKTHEIKEFESKTKCLEFLGISKPSGTKFFKGEKVLKTEDWELKSL